MQSEYARLADMSPAALAAAMEPYLPIARTLAQWIAQTRECPDQGMSAVGLCLNNRASDACFHLR
jgi:hypothetical protein